MNFFLSFFIFLFFKSFVVCCFGIIGGQPVGPFYPFFVKVRGARYSCGGSFIAKDAVLTAAHCLFEPEDDRWSNREEVYVLKGDFTSPNWRNTATWYACEEYYYHEAFTIHSNYGLSPFDIAVVKVRKRIQMAKLEDGFMKLCPDWKDYPEGFFIGIGKTRFSSTVKPMVLMGTSLVRYSSCRRFYQIYNLTIDEDSQVCYGSSYPGNSSGTCDCDAGGLILYQDSRSNAICLIGISSINPINCLHPQFPNIFIRAGHFANWIEETIALLKE